MTKNNFSIPWSVAYRNVISYIFENDKNKSKLFNWEKVDNMF